MGDTTKDAIKAWMQDVMARNGWSANQWGQKADVSSTTITRLVAGSRFTPSTRSLWKLAAVAGSAPDLPGFRQFVSIPQGTTIPLVSGVTLEGRPMTKALLTTLEATSPSIVVPFARLGSFAMRITEATMTAAGIMPGDLVVCVVGEHAAPVKGDVVLLVQGERVAPYRWHPPFLMPVSTTDEKPVALADHEDQLVGVVTDVIRQLRP